ncbi:hypothetical protein GCM10009617_12820 [Leifsonia poae]|uniref:Uncharacterized protein n=2 Tax=Leifsonia poae TaxID=110933 RepID=A0A9W6HB95_9MICO|nr:hypothetical protein GCM10017584_25040 [Leifsonia poae]
MLAIMESSPLIGFPWLGIILYVVFLAVIAGALYLIIRLAVFHALRSHSRWLARSSGNPPGPGAPPSS